MKRCQWTGKDPLMIIYHDQEWGVPVKDDHKWFEFIVLESFQAGLSWKTILHRREGFRKAFFNFDVKKVSKMKEIRMLELMEDKGIIRNKLKIRLLFLMQRHLWKFKKNLSPSTSTFGHLQITKQ